eukprot:scaffold14246_cov105-Isochrysis_galbana.AAC.5
MCVVCFYFAAESRERGEFRSSDSQSPSAPGPGATSCTSCRQQQQLLPVPVHTSDLSDEWPSG